MVGLPDEPASARDIVVLVHIREQHRRILHSYGRLHITEEEVQETGLRVGRPKRMNGIETVRTQRFKMTTDNNHVFNIAPNLLNQDFISDGPNQKWAGDILYIWTSEG